MELRRQLDTVAFAAAIAGIVAAGLAFAAIHNGAAAVMCMICLLGIIAGRLTGVRGAILLAVAAGLLVLLWISWIDPPAGPRRTSALVHFSGGALVGGALALTVRHHLSGAVWPIAVLLAVAAVAVGWELAEYAGDRIFETALAASKRDSALDIFFGCAGGALALTAVWLLRPARQDAA